jgi:5-(carboxyamino)imidazole ribonucleotide synthase
MYFTLAAQAMGYRVTVLEPNPASPAVRVADIHLCEAFDSPNALKTLAKTCAAVTTEFENVSVEAMRYLAKTLPVHPSAECVAIAQDRIAEKSFIQRIGLQTAPFLAIKHIDVLQTDLSPYLPGILKTTRLGYDGKGQALVSSAEEAATIYAAWQHQPCILEKRLALDTEISVTAVRTQANGVITFPPAENHHLQGILDSSIIPARVAPALLEKAIQMTEYLISQLEYVGVLTVEFFILEDGQLLINEMAPRPHNSAHFTLDATLSSQFEQQVRALCGLVPAKTTLTQPCVMVNILGDHWQQGEPNWLSILNTPHAKLHLYGKDKARPGRKMGHYTVLRDTVEAALKEAMLLKEML